MSEPLEPTLSNLGSGTLGVIITALIGLIYKLVGKGASDRTQEPTPAPQKSANDVKIEAIEHRLTSLETNVTHIDHKLDDVAVDVARAVGEIGTVAASMRGGTSGRSR